MTQHSVKQQHSVKLSSILRASGYGLVSLADYVDATPDPGALPALGPQMDVVLGHLLQVRKAFNEQPKAQDGAVPAAESSGAVDNQADEKSSEKEG